MPSPRRTEPAVRPLRAVARHTWSQHPRPRAARSPARSSLALTLAASLLAGCDSGRRAPTAAVGPDVRIDASNALAVASAAYRTAFAPVRVGRIAASFLDRAPPEPRPAGSPAVLVQEIEGPEGGSALFTWDDADGDDAYSSGDVFTIVCSSYGADGLVLTGAATLADVAIAGRVPDGFTWLVDARLELTGMQVTAGESTLTLSGALHVVREQRATVRLLALELDEALPVGTRTLHAGAGLARNDYVLDFSMGLFASGSFSDPLLGGALTFRTEAPLTGVQVMPDPSAGAFTVEGAGGTTLTLAPLDLFTLELLVDENGDGEVDTTLPAEWAEL